MHLRTLLSVCLFSTVAIWLAGCDLDFDEQRSTGPGGPGTGPSPGLGGEPALLRIESQGELVTPGEIITLVGLNMSQSLGENVPVFTAGRSSVEGLPIRVRVEGATSGSTALSSELDVVVPGGVTSGTVQLFVNGRSTSPIGYEAAPYIAGFTLGPNELQEVLLYQPFLGFIDGQSQVTIYGTNFSQIQQILLSDGIGNTRRVPAGSVIVNPGARTNVTVNGRNVPTGYDSLAFNLRDDSTDIRFPFDGPRQNLGVQLISASGNSNRVEVPVTTDPAATEIGAVISSTKVPTGVVTGSVPIQYSLYELKVDGSWTMNFQWSVNPNDSNSWFPAQPDFDDPDNDGTTNIYTGSVLQGPATGLLVGGGQKRSFVWDPCEDPNFLDLIEQQNAGIRVPRYQKISFRIVPFPEENRDFIDHVVQTPPVIYLYVGDREGDPASLLRERTFRETFANDARQAQETTASWGPPLNTNSLDGGVILTMAEIREKTGFWSRSPTVPVPNLDASDFRTFGTGRAVVDLSNSDPLPDPFDQQYFLIDTDRMTMEHVFVDTGDPGDPTDDTEGIEPVILVDENGAQVDNPGLAFNEFHFRSLRIGENTLVFGTGRNPVIIRLDGEGEGLDSDDEESFIHLGTLNLNGSNGGDGGNTGAPLVFAGAGGAGGAGGGNGGHGAILDIFPGSPVLRIFERATAGEADPLETLRLLVPRGGGFGETPAAVHPDEFRPQASVFAGAPGGGGGHRLPGLAGSYGSNTIPQYRIPRAGGGGVSRGDFRQVPVTGGSGGGGGGATLSRVPVNGVPIYAGTGGAGGGGGGGAVMVVARGRIVVEGVILANGGAGGNGTVPPPSADVPRGVAAGGAGGGGSGGSIVLRASGSVFLADCANLEVNGGRGGSSGTQNRRGEGSGAVGWVRIESETGGTPICSSLSTSVRPNGEVFMGGGLTTSPDDVPFGRGRDGALHLRFVQTLDPATGEPLVDETTGQLLSIYSFNTETGEILDASGQLVWRARSAPARPGYLDFVRLTIDEGVRLSAFGPNALEITVREVAEISGAISVSGFPGGALRFSESGREPLPGVGGIAGAGGGGGGQGGDIDFLNDDLEDKDPANTLPIDGEPGSVPPGAEKYDVTDLFGRGEGASSIVFPSVIRALGGVSQRGGQCGFNCIDTAPGGGGGGNLKVGDDGEVVLLIPDPVKRAAIIGRGGSAFGVDSVRFDGGVWLKGGTGGAGGAASPHVSNAYASKRVSGSYPFKGAALFAPGTGGGGGGGVLYLAAGNLRLGPRAALLAKGGDAYQSIDLGGNGGGGAGGNILVQVTNSISFEAGSVIDVSGGTPNRLPPKTTEGLLRYEGNIRTSAVDSAPSETGQAFGGLGGAGSPGRIRIEVPNDSAIGERGLNANVTTGPLLVDTVVSAGISRVSTLGLGTAGVALNNSVSLAAPVLRLNALQQPPGTSADLLWEGARESLHRHAFSDEPAQRVGDPRSLQDRQFVRFSVYFQSNYPNRTTQSIREVLVDYSLECE